MPDIGADPLDDPIDVKTAHAARVYDYWLGGKDNYAADRMVAEHILDVYPYVRASARANRAFHQRAAAWMARAGIRQFADVGCGLPAAENTHEIVQREDPAARVVYADHDAMVVVHAKGLLAGFPGVVALRGDVRDPEAVLASREARAVLRDGEPTALLLTAVLHFIEDKDDPAGLVARFLAGMAPGSCVAISHGSTDKLPQQAAQAGLEAYEMVLEPAVMRTWEQVRALFAGLELLPPWKGAVPAVVTVDGWLGPDVPLADAVPLARPGGEALWAGVAVKR
jgi:hypothetical protein